MAASTVPERIIRLVGNLLVAPISLLIGCRAPVVSPTSRQASTESRHEKGPALLPITEVIIFLERIHGGEFAYFNLVGRAIESRLACGENFQVVFWPYSPGDVIETMTGTQIAADATKFEINLNGRAGTPDPSGFVEGLNFCRELSRRNHNAEILVVGNGLTALEPIQRKSLHETSTVALVDLITCERSSSDFDDLTKLVSGFAVCVIEGLQELSSKDVQKAPPPQP